MMSDCGDFMQTIGALQGRQNTFSQSEEAALVWRVSRWETEHLGCDVAIRRTALHFTLVSAAAVIQYVLHAVCIRT